jgi:hypothetical protein
MQAANAPATTSPAPTCAERRVSRLLPNSNSRRLRVVRNWVGCFGCELSRDSGCSPQSPAWVYLTDHPEEDPFPHLNMSLSPADARRPLLSDPPHEDYASVSSTTTLQSSEATSDQPPDLIWILCGLYSAVFLGALDGKQNQHGIIIILIEYMQVASLRHSWPRSGATSRRLIKHHILAPRTCCRCAALHPYMVSLSSLPNSRGWLTLVLLQAACPTSSAAKVSIQIFTEQLQLMRGLS